MTPAEIIAELGELTPERLAIDIIADRHECTYTDIVLLIGATPEFNAFCAYHQRRHKNKAKKDATPADYRLSRMYQGGMTVAEISAAEAIPLTTVYKRINKCGTAMRPAGAKRKEQVQNV